MSKVCQISGKKASVVNVNLHKKKFYWVEQDMWIELLVSAHALRTINKIGLNAALKKAEKEGHLDFKDITIISF